MFGTLHWNSHSQEVKFVERPHGSANLEKSSACDRCRAKKVKCSYGDDGCSRCKRLGKKCTSNSMKPRGNQRMRHGSMNTSQQERMLDMFIPPSTTPSSPKNTEKEASSPAEPELELDDGEREQQQQLPDMPGTLDLSFLADFAQSCSHDVEDMSNLPLSPFFNAIHPDPGQPVPAVLSPPLSAQGELPHYLSAQHFQSLNSTAFSPPSSCHCLAAVVFAVEEVETSCSPGNRAELDSIIAYQKEATKCCRSMLKCSICASKRENLVLLVFMAEKLVSASARIVLLYRITDPSNTTTTNSTDPCPIPSNMNIRANVSETMMNFFPPTNHRSPLVSFEDRRHDPTPFATSASSSSSRLADYDYPTAPPDWREMLLGDYEISSATEWEHIVRVLIVLQMRGVMELLGDLKNICSDVLGETQTACLVQAEMRVSQLRREIHIT